MFSENQIYLCFYFFVTNVSPLLKINKTFLLLLLHTKLFIAYPDLIHVNVTVIFERVQTKRL